MIEAQIDYTFATENGKTITILTVRLVLTGWSAAVVVPFKGPVNYAVKWLAACGEPGSGHASFTATQRLRSQAWPRRRRRT